MLVHLSPMFALSAASPAAVAPLASGEGIEIPWLRLSLALLLSLSVAWGAVLWLRRRRGLQHNASFDFLFSGRSGAAFAQLRVIETRRASSHGDICLVEWDGKRHLVVVTQGGATLLESRSVEAVASEELP